MKRCYFLALLLTFQPVLAVQQEGSMWKFSVEEMKACDAQGGCTVITQMRMDRLVLQAFELGRKSCKGAI